MLLGSKAIFIVNYSKGNVTFLTKKPKRWMYVKEPITLGNETPPRLRCLTNLEEDFSNGR
mgnify:FL=1